jgi:glutamate--cysteine ligase
VGIRNPGGDYNQLATTLLQIENEFYGTIRPKRVIHQGERPLHALRERGVEYIEVRLMDLNPFEPIGIDAATLRFLDVFLLHCLLSDSPPDTPEEIRELAQNQHLTAARGREPGLQLVRHGAAVPLQQWGLEILDQLAPLAGALDALSGDALHQGAVAQARAALLAPDSLPSARVLSSTREQHGASFIDFVCTRSSGIRQQLLDLPWRSEQQSRFEAMAAASITQQQAIEAADTMPFDIYRQEYVSPARLMPRSLPAKVVSATA